MHQRPTVRWWQTKPTESIKPLFTLHFCALMLCLPLASLASFLSQIPSLFLLSLHLLCIFSPPHFFHCDVIYLRLTTVSVNIISICPLAWPQVNMLIRNCKPWQETEKRDEHFRKKRQRSEDFWRPFCLLVQHYLLYIIACLSFSEGMSKPSCGSVNVAQTDSLNDGEPCAVPTNHFRQQWKCH